MSRVRGKMSAERNKAMKSLSQLGRRRQPLNESKKRALWPCASHLTTGTPTQRTRASTQPLPLKILQQDALALAVLVNLDAAQAGLIGSSAFEGSLLATGGLRSKQQRPLRYGRNARS